MDAWIYQSALLCEDCTSDVRREYLHDHNNELPGIADSDTFPCGPHANGGGEADSPQHCDKCGVFLENVLTPDGDNYVRSQCAPYEAPDADGDVASWDTVAQRAAADGKPELAEWIRFYYAPGQ